LRLACDQSEQIRRLDCELRRVQDVTPALVVGVLAVVEARCSAPAGRDQAARIRNLIQVQAWTDGALALLELGLPQWTLRRIVYEDGEWHCRLGKQWPLPAWLDDSVEVSHSVLPLALLTAFVEAFAATACSTETARTEPSVAPAAYRAISCDNFS
jgi:hypothetical protein